MIINGDLINNSNEIVKNKDLEMISKTEFVKLMESATEKSNAAQALRAIGEKCQKVAQDMSNIKLKDLPAVIKALKLNSENDAADIDNVQKTVSQYLSQLTDTCMEASSKIDDLSYSIMGDLQISDSALQKVEDEIGLEDEIEDEIQDDVEETEDDEIDIDLDTDNLGSRGMK